MITTFHAVGEIEAELDTRLVLRGRERLLASLKENVLKGFEATAPRARLVTLEAMPKAGTTRALYEACMDMLHGGNLDDVRWAKPEAALATPNWYVASGKRLLLVFDAPENNTLLARIAEEASDHTRGAVFLVAANAVWLERLNRNLGPRHRVDSSGTVGRLPETDAWLLAADLATRLPQLRQEKLDDFKGWLTAISDRLPGWMAALTENILARKPDQRFREIADVYTPFVDEALKEFSKDRDAALALLQWLSATQPLYRTSEERVDALAALVEAPRRKVSELLAKLIAVRLLRGRGEDARLVDVHPRPLRDAILLQWLTFPDGDGRKLSEQAGSLADRIAASIAAGNFSLEMHRLLEALVAAEASCGGKDAVTKRVENALVETYRVPRPATAKLAVMEAASPLGGVNPGGYLRLLKTLRETETLPVQREGFQEITMQHDVVIAKLPRTLIGAAQYIREVDDKRAFLEELRNVQATESIVGREARMFEWTTQTAEGAVAEIVSRITDTEATFAHVASDLAMKELEALAGSATLRPEHLRWVLTLVRPQLRIERTELTGGPRGQVTFTTITPGPDHCAMKIRGQVRERVWKALESALVETHTLVALELLDVSHGAALGASRSPKGALSTERQYGAELLDDLQRLLRWMQVDRPIETLTAAREIWDWHFQFEPPGPVREAADECERKYLAACARASFAKTIWADHKNWRDAVDKDVQTLTSMTTADQMRAFYDQTFKISRKASLPIGFDDIAWKFGHNADLIGEKRKFFETVIEDPDPRVARIGLMMLNGHLDALRLQRRPVPEALKALVPTSKWATTVRELYASTGLALVERLQGDELALLVSAIHQDAVQGDQVGVKGLAVFAVRYPDATLSAFEQAIKAQRFSYRTRMLSVFIAALYWHAKPLVAKGREILSRLVKLLGLIPDLMDVNGNVAHELVLMAREWGVTLPLAELGVLLDQRYSLLAEMTGSEESEKTVPALDRKRWAWFHSEPWVYALFEPFTPEREEHRALVHTLVSWLGERDTTMYFLPPILAALDLNGGVVANAVGRAIDALGPSTSVTAFARYSIVAGAYATGSKAWRIVAEQILGRANAQFSEDKESRLRIYATMCFPGIVPYSSAVGEAPQIFLLQAQEAHAELASEPADSAFKEFLEWRTECAEAELAQQTHRIDEEFGRD